MNVVFISNDTQEAESLKRELTRQTPAVHIDISPDTQNALFRFVAPGSCNVILLDKSVPKADAVNLIVSVRNEKKAIGIVAIVGATETELPTELYYAGVDRFIVKRDGFVPLLMDALKQAKDRHRSESAHHAQQARLLYAGDTLNAQRHLSSLPYVILESLPLSHDGTLQLPDTIASPGDLIVIDSALTGAQTLKAIKEIHLKAPDIPIILLADPRDEDSAIQAMRLGAADCIARTDNYLHRLLPAVEREIKNRQLAREKSTLNSREDRLRQIVEIMPVGVTVIAPDGTFLAVNRTGLKLMGATRIEQIVGKNLIQLAPPEEHERILTFLTTISKWTGASISLNWKGPEGTAPGVEFRAVPMRRGNLGVAAALAAIYPPAGSSNGQSATEETDRKNSQEYETQIRKLQETFGQQQSQLEAALRQAESRRVAAEEHQARLKSAVEKATERSKLLLEEQRAEQAIWKQSLLELKEQCAKSEKAAQSLKSEQEGLLKTYQTEQEQWNLRRRELEQKQGATEANLAQVSETLRAERSQWNLDLGGLEQKCQAAEEQLAAVENALREAESRLTQQAEDHCAESSQMNLVRLGLERKCRAAEEALNKAESECAQLRENHNEERSQWEQSRSELEQNCQVAGEQASALQEALSKAKIQLAQQAEEQSAERSQWDLSRLELEQKFQVAEEQRAALKEALGRAEFQLEQRAEQNADASQVEAARQELEQKFQSSEEQRTALRDALHESEAARAQQNAAFKAERSQWDAARRELEQKCQAAEEQQTALQAALHESQSSLAELTEKHSAELSQRDLAQKELESKFQAAEEQHTTLQAALHDAESNLAQLAEKHSIELSQRDFAQKKTEQKYQTAEKQRAALQAALQDAESSLAKFTEERAQWELARLELERKYQDAEKQHVAAMQNAIRETESRLAWISEQNQAKATQLEQLQQEIQQLKADYGRITAESNSQRLRSQRLSQHTSAGIVLAQRDGRVLECNDVAARMFGYAGVEQALSQNAENPFRVYAFEGALDARLQQDGKLENIEWSSQGCDGRLIRIQENATLVEDPRGEGYLVERILTDISRIHNLNEEIRRVRRMESSDDLADATVKSFKDLCISMAQSSELLMETPEDGPAVRRIAEALLNDANRGVKHARQFLSATQKADRTPALLDLNEILTNNDAMLHSLIGEDIDLQTSRAQRVGLVSADRNEMIQLIGSLLASSREALPMGGTVNIETSNVEIAGPTDGHPEDLQPGIYVRMLFSADGCAIRPEKRAASIRTSVERMGGYLETSSDSRLGNINKVYFPRVEAFPRQADLLTNAAGA